MSHVTSLNHPPAGAPRAVRWALLRIFCLTGLAAVVCELIERLLSGSVTWWIAQGADVCGLAIGATLSVWLLLRKQFDLMRWAGTCAAEHQRVDAERAALARALDQASEAVVMTDRDGQIQYVNAAFSAMTGYSAAEAIGHSPRILKSGNQDPRFYEDLWKTVRAGKTWCGTLTNRRKDGSLYSEEMNITPVRDAGGAISGYIAIKQDVTERKAAEEARAFLASIVEATGDAVVGRDLNGIIVSWNRGAEAIFGYSAGEVVGKPIHAIVAPDMHDNVRHVNEALRRGENIPAFEGAGLKKDGTRMSLFLTVCPIRNAAGDIIGAASIIRDITERKRAQDERSLLASILESSEDAVYARDLNGILTCWNKGAESLYGYAASEVLGRHISILLPDGEPETEDLHSGIKQGMSRLETTRRKKDGTRVPVSLTVCPTRNAAGESMGAAGIARDITERQRAEQALRESEEKYRSLVANIPDVIWTADEGGRMVFMSRNCERMFGFSSAEMCESALWFERIHPADVGPVRQAYEALFREGREYSVEFRIERKDGRWIWVHERAISSYEKDGRHYTDGVVFDITERRQAFETIERLRGRTELILNSAGEGILGLDRDGRVTFANDAAARMLALDPGKLTSRSMHSLVLHSRPDGGVCAESDCAIHASIRNGMQRHAANDMFRRGDGGIFPVEFTRTPQLEEGAAAGAVVVFRDITEVKLAQERMQASLKEKEALLREIHHRVKNNLQVVCSLLNLQSRGLKDAEAKRVFDGTRHRVKAMALVHETLYQSGDLALIDFSAYVSRLLPQLMHAYGLSPERVRGSIAVESVKLPIDTAIPCALMLTELVSNSLKHTMGASRRGELGIVFRGLGDRDWLLEVSNPAGPETVESEPRSSPSFGLQLVRLLTEQLNGTVEIARQPDFRVTVVFPAGNPAGEG